MYINPDIVRLGPTQPYPDKTVAEQMDRDRGGCALLTGRRPKWVREFFAEFFGTFFIVCIGDGAIANYMLNKNNKTGIDHFAVCFSFGVGVLIGVSIASKISGAHLNPAVTVALASMGKFKWRKIPHYLLGQYLGSFMAAFAIFCAYYEGIDAYDEGVRTAYNGTAATGGIFSTYPAQHISVPGTLVDQILATFLLMFAVMAITDPKGIATPKHMEPTVLALVITGICVAFGLNCGAVLNPARDLGPRLFQVLAGYGFDAFKPLNWQYWLSAGIIGPHIGAIIGGWTYEVAISDKTYLTDGEEEQLRDRKVTDQVEHKMSPIYMGSDVMNDGNNYRSGVANDTARPLMSNSVTNYIEDEGLEIDQNPSANCGTDTSDPYNPRNSIDFSKSKCIIVLNNAEI